MKRFSPPVINPSRIISVVQNRRLEIQTAFFFLFLPVLRGILKNNVTLHIRGTPPRGSVMHREVTGLCAFSNVHIGECIDSVVDKRATARRSPGCARSRLIRSGSMAVACNGLRYTDGGLSSHGPRVWNTKSLHNLSSVVPSRSREGSPSRMSNSFHTPRGVIDNR